MPYQIALLMRFATETSQNLKNMRFRPNLAAIFADLLSLFSRLHGNRGVYLSEQNLPVRLPTEGPNFRIGQGH